MHSSAVTISSASLGCPFVISIASERSVLIVFSRSFTSTLGPSQIGGRVRGTSRKGGSCSLEIRGSEEVDSRAHQYELAAPKKQSVRHHHTATSLSSSSSVPQRLLLKTFFWKGRFGMVNNGDERVFQLSSYPFFFSHSVHKGVYHVCL